MVILIPPPLLIWCSFFCKSIHSKQNTLAVPTSNKDKLCLYTFQLNALVFLRATIMISEHGYAHRRHVIGAHWYMHVTLNMWVVYDCKGHRSLGLNPLSYWCYPRFRKFEAFTSVEVFIPWGQLNVESLQKFPGSSGLYMVNHRDFLPLTLIEWQHACIA